MPTDARSASQAELQRYLEQLYGNSSFYKMMMSPQNTKNLLIQGAAAQDSQPSPAPISSITQNLSPAPRVTSPAARMTHPKLDPGNASPWNAQPNAYPEQLHDSGIAQIIANRNARMSVSNAIPNMNLTPQAKRPTGQIGTPNQTIMNLEAARAKVDANAAKPGFGSPGKTSLQLDPNLNASNPLADIEAQIRALAGTPDIPEHWISPYSQSYLNQLGDRLSQAGSEAQQQFQGAIGDVVNNYAQGNQVRDTTNAALANELQTSGGNIGINYAASNQGQQAKSDAEYLSQMSGANQATDTSFMSKMGEMAALSGNNLGFQAREGLLTPKQFVGREGGLSEGDSALLSFLGSKYGMEKDSQDLITKLAADAATKSATAAKIPDFTKYMNQPTQSASTTTAQKNPLVPQAIEGITNPAMKAAAISVYNAAGSNPVQALADIEKQITDLGPAPRLLSGVGGHGAPGYGPFIKYRDQLAQLNDLRDFFMPLSTGWNAVPEEVSTTDKSSQDMLTPELLAYLMAQMANG